jgi:ATP:cob(I)alamin adenosyltransferase
MGIITKKGDKGFTFLYKGGRVKKDDLRIEICGCLDEVVAFLGLSKCLTKKKTLKRLLERIQKDLFLIGTEIATLPSFLKSFKKRIEKKHIDYLEEHIKDLEKKKVLKKKGFYLPTDNLFSGYLEISRVLTRKVERRIVSLKNKKGLKNNFILIYLNRLSDLLYLLARKEEKNPKNLK